jgi:hypothetical protein
VIINKKYPWKVRRILKKKWKDIDYLFKGDDLKEKREKYIDGLIRKMTHEEALIYAYSDRDFRKEEEEKRKNIKKEIYFYLMILCMISVKWNFCINSNMKMVHIDFGNFLLSM